MMGGLPDGIGIGGRRRPRGWRKGRRGRRRREG